MDAHSERERYLYQLLSTVQHELKQMEKETLDMNERYSNTINDMQSNMSTVHAIMEFEESNADNQFHELKHALEEVDRVRDEGNMCTDRLERMEIELEEIRAKEIMLSEKSSKLEQQLYQTQQELKGKEEQFLLEKNVIRGDVLRNQEEANNLRQQVQTLRTSKRDSEEKEKQLTNQVRVLTDSVKKLQKQLEETKNLMKMVQQERSNLAKESDTLRTELHQALQTPTVKSTIAEQTPKLASSFSLKRATTPTLQDTEKLSQSSNRFQLKYSSKPFAKPIATSTPSTTTRTVSNNNSGQDSALHDLMANNRSLETQLKQLQNDMNALNQL